MISKLAISAAPVDRLVMHLSVGPVGRSSAVFLQDGDNHRVCSFDRIIQRRSPFGSTPVDVRAIGDKYLSSSCVRLRITFALRGTAHRSGMKGSRADDGILIHVGTVLQQ